MAAQQEEIYSLLLPLPSPIALWKYPALFNDGCLVIPCSLLHFYAHLKPYPLSPGEILFVLHVIEHVFAENSLPSYKQLSARMGVTHKMVRRYAKSLEGKNYLRREPHAGSTTRFDLTSLFDAVRVASCGSSNDTQAPRR